MFCKLPFKCDVTHAIGSMYISGHSITMLIFLLLKAFKTKTRQTKTRQMLNKTVIIFLCFLL
jgi:hypothetical protein